MLESLFMCVEVPTTLLKRDSNVVVCCFPVNIADILRTSFLQNTSGRLLLEVESENISQWGLNYTLQEQ